MSPSEGDRNIESTLGNFNLAAPFLTNDSKQIIGISTASYPQTPVAQRAPPVFTSTKQPQSQFNNGLTTSLPSQQQQQQQSSSVNRTYNNNNNNNNTQNNNNNNNTNTNNTAINNNTSNYPQKSSTNSFQPPQSRANVPGNSTLSNNTFLRPDSKPIRNGHSTVPQLNKHEVNITL